MEQIKIATLFLLLIITAIAVSCGISPATDAVNKVERLHIEKQLKKYGFRCRMTGGGGDGTRIRRINIGFYTRKTLTIDTARRYLVEGVLDYLNELNRRESLKEYLTDWPFELKNMRYSLSVHVGDGVWPQFPNGLTPDKKISYAELSNGMVYYLIDIPSLPLPEDIHSETFEEAIAILKAQGWCEPAAKDKGP